MTLVDKRVVEVKGCAAIFPVQETDCCGVVGGGQRLEIEKGDIGGLVRGWNWWWQGRSD